MRLVEKKIGVQSQKFLWKHMEVAKALPINL